MELRRDRDVTWEDFFFALLGCAALVLETFFEPEGLEAEPELAAVSEVCATAVSAHTSVPDNSAMKNNLRNPTTSF
jgi:hypothetical protein